MCKLVFTIFICLIHTSLSALTYVSAPVSNMYSEPKEFSDVVSQTIWGMQVEIVETKEPAWVKVRTADDYLGWMKKSSLTEPVRGLYPSLGELAVVSSLFANIYWEPSHKTFQPLMILPYGSRLEVFQPLESPLETWVPVRLLDHQIAYVHLNDIKQDPQPLSLQEMLVEAKRFIGIPYQWGGVSSFGIDCSGYTQMLYGLMGIKIPRDSKPQSEWEEFQEVSLDEAQEGDLIFFSDAADGTINHVGIYLGDYQFIHASLNNTPPGVQISSLDKGKWKSIFKKCMHLDLEE